MYYPVYKLVVTVFTTAFLAKTTVFPTLGNLGGPVCLDFDAELKESRWGRTELAQGHVGGWSRAVVALPKLSVGLVSLGTVTWGLQANVCMGLDIMSGGHGCTDQARCDCGSSRLGAFVLACSPVAGSTSAGDVEQDQGLAACWVQGWLRCHAVQAQRRGCRRWAVSWALAGLC